MIDIQNKVQCCGCSACVEKCPKHCIKLKEDREGFLYPVVDKTVCIDCGLCEKVCLMLSSTVFRPPLKVYASVNTDAKIRQASSSGGIFTLLAGKVIAGGGVVFGACFDEAWEVQMAFAENMEGISSFRGSKYLQARVEYTYKETENFLKQGRQVLYSGTPCQIAGLKKFLRHDYDNLLAVDFVCHGVPSPKVWRKYLSGILARQGNGKNTVLSHSKNQNQTIENIEFRSKSTGWKKYSFALTLSKAEATGEKNTVLLSSVFSENVYMRAFLSNLILRPSCHSCPSKEGKSGSDITIADFWGIENCMPDMDDDKGTGLVLINSRKGMSFFPQDGVKVKECTYDEAFACNPSLKYAASPHPRRTKFFALLDKEDFDMDQAVARMLKTPLMTQIKSFAVRMVRHFIRIVKL